MLKQGGVILLLLFVLLLPTCRKPAYVLSEKQMENLLFDIHIAEAEISDNYINFRTDKQKQVLYTSVFEKHKITREQFDTSLVWYGKNLPKYLGIYDRLNVRYSILSDSITAKIDLQNQRLILAGDSSQLNLWKEQRAFILTSRAGKNTFSFDIDTLKLSPQEYYELMFDVLGITDSIAAPLVTFGIGFPDSVFVERKKIKDNGLFTVSLPSADSISNKPSFHLFGFISLPAMGDKKIVIHNIGLYKKKKEKTQIE